MLKWWPWTRPADQMRQAAATVEAARAAGWPTPAWLHWGIRTDGRPYEIQEFVEGRHLSDLDADSLQLLLEINERQADLDPLRSTTGRRGCKTSSTTGATTWRAGWRPCPLKRVVSWSRC